MAFNITDTFVRQVNSAWEMLSAQRESHLLKHVKQTTCTGNLYQVNRVHDPDLTGDLNVTTTRHGTTIISDMDHSRRNAFMTDYQKSYLIDEEDKAKMLTDPTSEYLIELRGAYSRTLERKIIHAGLGVAATGESGQGSVALADETTLGQSIPADGTGLTLAKVREARTMFLQNYVDLAMNGRPIIATNAEGLEDLRSDSGLVSVDNVPYQSNYDPSTPFIVHGFEIIPVELLSTITDYDASSTNRPAIAMTNRALHLAFNINPMLRVSQLPERNYSYLLHIKAAFGAVRVQGQEVVDIRFTEA